MHDCVKCDYYGPNYGGPRIENTDLIEKSAKGFITVDACMHAPVLMLNKLGVQTLGCCCGHGKRPGVILIKSDDGPTFELELPKINTVL